MSAAVGDPGAGAAAADAAAARGDVPLPAVTQKLTSIVHVQSGVIVIQFKKPGSDELLKNADGTPVEKRMAVTVGGKGLKDTELLAKVQSVAKKLFDNISSPEDISKVVLKKGGTVSIERHPPKDSSAAAVSAAASSVAKPASEENISDIVKDDKKPEVFKKEYISLLDQVHNQIKFKNELSTGLTQFTPEIIKKVLEKILSEPHPHHIEGAKWRPTLADRLQERGNEGLSAALYATKDEPATHKGEIKDEKKCEAAIRAFILQRMVKEGVCVVGDKDSKTQCDQSFVKGTDGGGFEEGHSFPELQRTGSDGTQGLLEDQANHCANLGYVHVRAKEDDKSVGTVTVRSAAVDTPEKLKELVDLACKAQVKAAAKGNFTDGAFRPVAGQPLTFEFRHVISDYTDHGDRAGLLQAVDSWDEDKSQISMPVNINGVLKTVTIILKKPIVENQPLTSSNAPDESVQKRSDRSNFVANQQLVDCYFKDKKDIYGNKDNYKKHLDNLKTQSENLATLLVEKFGKTKEHYLKDRLIDSDKIPNEQLIKSGEKTFGEGSIFGSTEFELYQKAIATVLLHQLGGMPSGNEKGALASLYAVLFRRMPPDDKSINSMIESAAAAGPFNWRPKPEEALHALDLEICRHNVCRGFDLSTGVQCRNGVDRTGVGVAIAEATDRFKRETGDLFVPPTIPVGANELQIWKDANPEYQKLLKFKKYFTDAFEVHAVGSAVDLRGYSGLADRVGDIPAAHKYLFMKEDEKAASKKAVVGELTYQDLAARGNRQYGGKLNVSGNFVRNAEQLEAKQKEITDANAKAVKGVVNAVLGKIKSGHTAGDKILNDKLELERGAIRKLGLRKEDIPKLRTEIEKVEGGSLEGIGGLSDNEKKLLEYALESICQLAMRRVHLFGETEEEGLSADEIARFFSKVDKVPIVSVADQIRQPQPAAASAAAAAPGAAQPLRAAGVPLPLAAAAASAAAAAGDGIEIEEEEAGVGQRTGPAVDEVGARAGAAPAAVASGVAQPPRAVGVPLSSAAGAASAAAAAGVGIDAEEEAGEGQGPVPDAATPLSAAAAQAAAQAEAAAGTPLPPPPLAVAPLAAAGAAGVAPILTAAQQQAVAQAQAAIAATKQQAEAAAAAAQVLAQAQAGATPPAAALGEAAQAQALAQAQAASPPPATAAAAAAPVAEAAWARRSTEAGPMPGTEPPLQAQAAAAGTSPPPPLAAAAPVMTAKPASAAAAAKQQAEAVAAQAQVLAQVQAAVAQLKDPESQANIRDVVKEVHKNEEVARQVHLSIDSELNKAGENTISKERDRLIEFAVEFYDQHLEMGGERAGYESIVSRRIAKLVDNAYDTVDAKVNSALVKCMGEKGIPIPEDPDKRDNSIALDGLIETALPSVQVEIQETVIEQLEKELQKPSQTDAERAQKAEVRLHLGDRRQKAMEAAQRKAQVAAAATPQPAAAAAAKVASPERETKAAESRGEQTEQPLVQAAVEEQVSGAAAVVPPSTPRDPNIKTHTFSCKTKQVDADGKYAFEREFHSVDISFPKTGTFKDLKKAIREELKIKKQDSMELWSPGKKHEDDEPLSKIDLSNFVIFVTITNAAAEAAEAKEIAAATARLASLPTDDAPKPTPAASRTGAGSEPVDEAQQPAAAEDKGKAVAAEAAQQAEPRVDSTIERNKKIINDIKSMDEDADAGLVLDSRSIATDVLFNVLMEQIASEMEGPTGAASQSLIQFASRWAMHHCTTEEYSKAMQAISHKDGELESVYQAKIALSEALQSGISEAVDTAFQEEIGKKAMQLLGAKDMPDLIEKMNDLSPLDDLKFCQKQLEYLQQKQDELLKLEERTPIEEQRLKVVQQALESVAPSEKLSHMFMGRFIQIAESLDPKALIAQISDEDLIHWEKVFVQVAKNAQDNSDLQKYYNNIVKMIQARLYPKEAAAAEVASAVQQELEKQVAVLSERAGDELLAVKDQNMSMEQILKREANSARIFNDATPFINDLVFKVFQEKGISKEFVNLRDIAEIINKDTIMEAISENPVLAARLRKGELVLDQQTKTQIEQYIRGLLSQDLPAIEKAVKSERNLTEIYNKGINELKVLLPAICNRREYAALKEAIDSLGIEKIINKQAFKKIILENPELAAKLENGKLTYDQDLFAKILDSLLLILIHTNIFYSYRTQDFKSVFVKIDPALTFEDLETKLKDPEGVPENMQKIPEAINKHRQKEKEFADIFDKFLNLYIAINGKDISSRITQREAQELFKKAFGLEGDAFSEELKKNISGIYKKLFLYLHPDRVGKISENPAVKKWAEEFIRPLSTLVGYANK